MRSAHSGRSPWWMDQVSFASVSAGAPVASRSCAAAAADGASPITWPPLSPTPEPGCAWRWFSRRRPGRSPAAAAPRRCTWNEPERPVRHPTRSRWRLIPAAPAPPCRRPGPGRRCGLAAATSRCSAARIRAEVNRSDPATVYTLEPSARRKAAGSVMPSSGRVNGHRPGLQHLGDEQLNQLLDLVGGNLRGPDVALRFGADMPALPGRTPLLHRRQHLLRGRCHPLRIHGRARRRGRG